MYFLEIFVVFHQKICVFIIFISFFDEVSNLRILTNQKPELLIRNCQCNCMLISTASNMVNCLFQWKKNDYDVDLNCKRQWSSRRTEEYVLRFFAENVHCFLFLFFGWVLEWLPPLPPSPSPCAFINNGGFLVQIING